MPVWTRYGKRLARRTFRRWRGAARRRGRGRSAPRPWSLWTGLRGALGASLPKLLMRYATRSRAKRNPLLHPRNRAAIGYSNASSVVRRPRRDKVKPQRFTFYNPIGSPNVDQGSGKCPIPFFTFQSGMHFAELQFNGMPSSYTNSTSVAHPIAYTQDEVPVQGTDVGERIGEALMIDRFKASLCVSAPDWGGSWCCRFVVLQLRAPYGKAKNNYKVDDFFEDPDDITSPYKLHSCYNRGNYDAEGLSGYKFRVLQDKHFTLNNSKPSTDDLTFKLDYKLGRFVCEDPTNLHSIDESAGRIIWGLFTEKIKEGSVDNTWDVTTNPSVPQIKDGLTKLPSYYGNFRIVWRNTKN